MIKSAITDLKIYVYPFQKEKEKNKTTIFFSAIRDNKYSWPCITSVQRDGRKDLLQLLPVLISVNL